MRQRLCKPVFLMWILVGITGVKLVFLATAHLALVENTAMTAHAVDISRLLVCVAGPDCELLLHLARFRWRRLPRTTRCRLGRRLLLATCCAGHPRRHLHQRDAPVTCHTNLIFLMRTRRRIAGPPMVWIHGHRYPEGNETIGQDVHMQAFVLQICLQRQPPLLLTLRLLVPTARAVPLHIIGGRETAEALGRSRRLRSACYFSPYGSERAQTLDAKW
jgi:hypothetical protein